jgi:hypothetical protein
MTHLPDRTLVGFVDLDLGRKAVRVPVQAVDPSTEQDTSAPLVSFECEGGLYEIIVRGDANSAAVASALEQVAARAVRQLSAKLLN